MNKEFYIKNAMLKRAEVKENLLSKAIPDSLKEVLIIKWMKLFSKKTGLSKLFGSGAFEFLKDAWESSESPGDFIDYIEEEGFREPKTDFGRNLAKKLKELTSISDTARFILEVLSADGTKELKEITGIPFTKPTKEEILKGKVDISSQLGPVTDTGKWILENTVSMSERILGILIYSIPFILRLVDIYISKQVLGVLHIEGIVESFKSDLKISNELAKLFLLFLFGNSSKRGSVPKKIILLLGGSFFTIINDLYSFIGWSTKELMNFIIKRIDKYSKWVFFSLTLGVSEANRYLKRVNKEENKKEKEELKIKKELDEKRRNMEAVKFRKIQIKNLLKEQVDLQKRLRELKGI